MSIWKKVLWNFPGIMKGPNFHIIRSGSLLDLVILHMRPRIGYYRDVRVGSQIHGRFSLKIVA